MKNIIILIIFILTSTISAFSQDTNYSEQIKGKYITRSLGFSTGKLRDYSTSPLYYNYVMPCLSINYAEYYNINSWEISLKNYAGINYKIIDESNSHIGFLCDFDLDGHYYHKIKSFKDNKIKLFVGGNSSIRTGARVLPSFGNASLSMSYINDLAFNFKTDFLFKRPAKTGKFLGFIKYKRQEKHYQLSLKLGLPLATTILRPTYTAPGNYTNNINLFNGYGIYTKLFSGLNTDISISRILPNGNKVKFTYYWEITSTGNIEYNKYNISRHLFMLSLDFKIK